MVYRHLYNNNGIVIILFILEYYPWGEKIYIKPSGRIPFVFVQPLAGQQHLAPYGPLKKRCGPKSRTITKAYNNATQRAARSVSVPSRTIFSQKYIYNPLLKKMRSYWAAQHLFL